MNLEELVGKLASAPDLDATKKAIVILWNAAAEAPGRPMTAYALAQILAMHRLGNPNREVLKRGLASSPLTLRSGRGFVLKSGADATVRSWLRGDTVLAVTDHAMGYLPGALWKNTRGYIEKVCDQLNGCYQYGFYDAAAVMTRRLFETLIIEAYEHLNRSGDVLDKSGNYLLLGDLVGAALGQKGLGLGREAKGALQEIKKLGDRSAHNRRFNAVKADLDQIRSATRVASDELINLAVLRHD
jgi:hypothetical protein